MESTSPLTHRFMIGLVYIEVILFQLLNNYPITRAGGATNYVPLQTSADTKLFSVTMVGKVG